jgi:hypothetical protein
VRETGFLTVEGVRETGFLTVEGVFVTTFLAVEGVRETVLLAFLVKGLLLFEFGDRVLLVPSTTGVAWGTVLPDISIINQYFFQLMYS